MSSPSLPDSSRHRSWSNRTAFRLCLGLILVLAILLVMMPAEQTLGGVIKLVFVHGALIRVSLIMYGFTGLLGAVWLVRRRPAIRAWLIGLQRGSFTIWCIYLLSSSAVTYLAWSTAIAWGEPRVMATLRITLAAVVILGVCEYMKLTSLRAIGAIATALLAILATQTAEVIRHPIDPIGTSPSIVFKVFYLAILSIIVALATLMSYWMRDHREKSLL